MSRLTIDAPELSYALYIVIDGKRYRNTAAMPNPPILVQILRSPARGKEDFPPRSR